MTPKRILAYASLVGSATPNGVATGGLLTIGNSRSLNYDPATHTIFARRVRIFSAAATAQIALNLGTGSVVGAWTPPTAQVETATVVGTITLGGNATVTVTSAAITGSPMVLSVPVVLADTATVVAGKIRSAMLNKKAITDKYAITGVGAAIILTRLIDDAGVANDATLNVAIANGSCTGLTAAPSSANTTAGVLALGALVDVITGTDAEGLPLPTMAGPRAISIDVIRGGIGYDYGGDNTGVLTAGAQLLVAGTSDITLGTVIDLVNLNSTVAEAIITVVQIKGA